MKRLLHLIGRIKNTLKRSPLLLRFYNVALSKNVFILGHGNKIDGLDHARLKNTTVRFVGGTGNCLTLGRDVFLTSCTITIYGNKSAVMLGDGALCNHAEFHLEDDGSEIIIGKQCKLTGSIHLAATEGRKIIIGDDCLFSNHITIRNGDSHSIIERETGKRINPAEDVQIDEHVWVGHNVTILKGAHIGRDSIVAAGAIVTRDFSAEQHVIIAGLPGKVISHGITWKNERI